MAKRNSLKEAPYSASTGHLLEWASRNPGSGVTWKPNVPFGVKEMLVVGMERGRSAARFILEDVDTGTRYPMFMSSMVDLLSSAEHISWGVIWRENWIVVKKGTNYGIEVFRDAD